MMQQDDPRLRALWVTLAKTLLEALTKGKPKAATMNVARLFLADNGINKDTLTGARDTAAALQAMLDALPDGPEGPMGYAVDEPKQEDTGPVPIEALLSGQGVRHGMSFNPELAKVAADWQRHADDCRAREMEVVPGYMPSGWVPPKWYGCIRKYEHITAPGNHPAVRILYDCGKEVRMLLDPPKITEG